jgi:hypothetical protein
MNELLKVTENFNFYFGTNFDCLTVSRILVKGDEIIEAEGLDTHEYDEMFYGLIEQEALRDQ